MVIPHVPDFCGTRMIAVTLTLTSSLYAVCCSQPWLFRGIDTVMLRCQGSTSVRAVSIKVLCDTAVPGLGNWVPLPSALKSALRETPASRPTCWMVVILWLKAMEAIEREICAHPRGSRRLIFPSFFFFSMWCASGAMTIV